MDREEFLNELKKLYPLYVQTKKLILEAEQVDPEARSHIAVFKEQRDAFDHLMRTVVSFFEDGNACTLEIVSAQLEKARGHLYRAAYDSLDGVGVSWKLRIEKITKDLSNDCITVVYPEYFDHIGELDRLDAQIAEHRSKKNVGAITQKHLDDYSTIVGRVAEIGKTVSNKGKAFADYNKRRKREDWLKVILIPVIIGIALAVCNVTIERIWPEKSKEAVKPTESLLPIKQTHP